MIKVNDLYFSFDTNPILKKINFSVEPGQIYCLLGKNGSGKTTLIRLISGFLDSYRGSITIDNIDINEYTRKTLARKISYVPQGHKGYFNYSVINMIVMGRAPYLNIFSRPGKGEYKRARRVIEELGIGHLINRNYMSLSGGEKRLVFIGRALVQDTDYIFLDEPTSNLDFSNKNMIVDILTDIASKKQCGIVVAMHDPNLVFSLADNVIMLKNGRIINKGNINIIMDEVNMEELYDMKIDMINISNNRRVFIKN